MEIHEKLYLKLEEVSKIFSVPINTIRKLASKRAIPVYRPFGGRRLYVRLEEVEELFKRCKLKNGVKSPCTSLAGTARAVRRRYRMNKILPHPNRQKQPRQLQIASNPVVEEDYVEIYERAILNLALSHARIEVRRKAIWDYLNMVRRIESSGGGIE